MAGVSDAGTLEGDASAEEREAAVHDVIQTIARTTFDLDAVLQAYVTPGRKSRPSGSRRSQIIDRPVVPCRRQRAATRR